MRQFVFVISVLITNAAAGKDFPFNEQQLTVPNGLLVEQIAAQPLVERPVIAEFDEYGRLYVTDMPAGLEKQMSPQEFADLVKYLKEGRRTAFAEVTVAWGYVSLVPAWTCPFQLSMRLLDLR